MQHKIVISDRDFTVKEELQDMAQNLSWDYNRIGGCGFFSFDLPIDYCTDRFLGGNFNVKIYTRGSDGTYSLRYQGKVENKNYSVRSGSELVSVRGNGYQSELNDILVSETYSSQEASVIVKDILDTYVTPNTNISYDAGDISATSFTFDTLEFNADSVNSCIQKIADTVGNREWGVDKDRKLFFKQRSSSIGFRYPLGKNVISYGLDIDFKSIINRVTVVGGEISGTSFTRTVEDLKSQVKWNRRDRLFDNSSVTTNAVADQLGASIIEEFKESVYRGRLQIISDQMIESTVPIPLVEVVTARDKYGSRKYGTGLYNGVIDHQINRINYDINEEGTQTISMSIGKLRPDIAESINQLKYQLDQERSKTL